MPANVNKVLKTKFNPNLGGLFSFEVCACVCVCVCVCVLWVCVCGWRGGGKTTPCLKLVRIMIKT